MGHNKISAADLKNERPSNFQKIKKRILCGSKCMEV